MYMKYALHYLLPALFLVLYFGGGVEAQAQSQEAPELLMVELHVEHAGPNDEDRAALNEILASWREKYDLHVECHVQRYNGYAVNTRHLPHVDVPKSVYEEGKKRVLEKYSHATFTYRDVGTVRAAFRDEYNKIERR